MPSVPTPLPRVSEGGVTCDFLGGVRAVSVPPRLPVASVTESLPATLTVSAFDTRGTLSLTVSTLATTTVSRLGAALVATGWRIVYPTVSPCTMSGTRPGADAGCPLADPVLDYAGRFQNVNTLKNARAMKR